MVESAQIPPNAWYNHPRLLHVQHDWMNHRHVNYPWGTGILNLPDQHPRQPRPLLTCPSNVVDHRWKVVFHHREDSTKVLEGGEQGKGDPICSDIHLCPCPCFLLRQAAPLPLLPPAEKGHCKVPAIEGLVQHKHVALGAPGLRLVTLLQDNYFFPCMAVRKVNPEIGPIWSPTHAPLYWEPDPQQTFR